MINRRSLITGLVSLVAAPAIVRAGSLMPVKVMTPPGADVCRPKACAGRKLTPLRRLKRRLFRNVFARWDDIELGRSAD